MKMMMTGFLTALMLLLLGCQSQNTEDYSSFEGTVIRADETHIIVEPFEEEDIRRSGFEVSIPIDKNSFQVGDKVKVTHEGPVMESHPLQIRLIEIERIN